MDRRKFLGVGLSAGAATVATLAVKDFPAIDVKEDLPYFEHLPNYKVLGETIKFVRQYDACTDCFTIVGRWRHKGATYALGAKITAHDVAYNPSRYAAILDRLQNNFKNTVYIKKRGIHVYSEAAPWTPDGSVAPVI